MNTAPSLSAHSEPQVWEWYLRALPDCEQAGLSATELQFVREYYREAGLNTQWRRAFFRRHFSVNFAQMASFLFACDPDPQLLDLGCGTGTQALYLAAMGARVVAVDMDRRSLAILIKRRRFYEETFNRALAIDVIEENVLTVDLSSYVPLDGVFSLFAFNMMQPSSDVFARVSDWLRPGGAFALLDGNTESWLARVWPGRRRRAWSATRAAFELTNADFAVRQHRGGIAVPPLGWAIHSRCASAIDARLTRSLGVSVSHLLFASKSTGDQT